LIHRCLQGAHTEIHPQIRPKFAVS
jgi:hypothetical protein